MSPFFGGRNRSRKRVLYRLRPCAAQPPTDCFPPRPDGRVIDLFEDALDQMLPRLGSRVTSRCCATGRCGLIDLLSAATPSVTSSATDKDRTLGFVCYVTQPRRQVAAIRGCSRRSVSDDPLSSLTHALSCHEAGLNASRPDALPTSLVLRHRSFLSQQPHMISHRDTGALLQPVGATTRCPSPCRCHAIKGPQNPFCSRREELPRSCTPTLWQLRRLPFGKAATHAICSARRYGSLMLLGPHVDRLNVNIFADN